MRTSKANWIVSILTRWIVGAWLLVSFTASASIDATHGVSSVTFRDGMTRTLAAQAPSGLAALDENDPLIIVPVDLGLGSQFSFDAGGPPRYQAKLGVDADPVVQSVGKGDALPSYAPMLEGRTPEPAFSMPIAEVMVIGSQSDDRASGEETAVRGEGRKAGSTPVVVAVTSTPETRLIAPPTSAQPIRAARLAPLESLASVVFERPRAEHPNFVGLIDPSDSVRQQKCLAEAVYFEARSEPIAGQAAVAQVVLNRVSSAYYPKSVCEVVYQNRDRYLGCEFTFVCEGKSLAIEEPGPWAVAVRIARAVYDGQIFNSAVGQATHYHADYVRPYWAKALEKRDVIGRHIFYSLKPGLPGGICPGCLSSSKG